MRTSDEKLTKEERSLIKAISGYTTFLLLTFQMVRSVKDFTNEQLWNTKIRGQHMLKGRYDKIAEDEYPIPKALRGNSRIYYECLRLIYAADLAHEVSRCKPGARGRLVAYTLAMVDACESVLWWRAIKKDIPASELEAVEELSKLL